MKTNFLLAFLLYFSLNSVWSQQPPKKTPQNLVKPQPSTTTKKPVTNSTQPVSKPVSKPPAAQAKKPTKPAVNKTQIKNPTPQAIAEKKDTVEKVEEKKVAEKEAPLAVYVVDTTTKYIRGNLKMGDEYIDSRYTPNTITVLFVNDFFDKKDTKKPQFIGDKVELSDKFYTNQETITQVEKLNIIENLHGNITNWLLREIYSPPTRDEIKKNFNWIDTTISIKKQKSIATEKLVKSGIKANLGMSLSGKHLNTSDSLGISIRDVLLKNDIPSKTMRVWLDPKQVLKKSKDMLLIGDLANNIDPKKRIIYQSLLKQNFIMVVGIFNVHEVIIDKYEKNSRGKLVVVGKEYTNNIDADVRCFLYKIQMNPVAINNLATDGNIKRIPLEYKSRLFLKEISVRSSVFGYSLEKIKRPLNTEKFKDPKFMEDIYGQVMEKLMEELEKEVEDFKMRSGVTQIKPFFAAEMGTKQGIYVDQKYGVYRYEKDITKNEVNAIKVANVRMTKVALNREKDKEVTKKFETKSALANSVLKNTTEGLNLFKAATNQNSGNDNNKSSPNSEKAVSPISGFKLFNSTTSTPPKTPSTEEVKKTKEEDKKNIEEREKKLAIEKLKKTKQDSLNRIKFTKDSLKAAADSLHRWSHFKPISVGKIESGDFLLQEDDKGISVILGGGTNGLFPTFNFGAEYSISRIFKRSPKFPSGLKIGVLLNNVTNDYRFYYENSDGEDVEGSTIFTIYVAKEYYLTPIIDIRPYVGYESSGEKGGVRLGITAPLNIYQGRFKLMPEVSLQTVPREGIKIFFGGNLKFDF